MIDGRYRVLKRFLTSSRLTWYPRFLLLGLALGFVIAVSSGNGAETIGGRLGGDYPAFYGAGRIIAEGDWRALYKAERQLQAQKGLFPGEAPGFMPFPYPPYVALAYWPLSLFGYRTSFAIHTILMVLALALTVHLVQPMNTKIKQHFLAAFTLLLFFYPVLRAVLGGQNTPITLLLVAAAWRYAVDHRDLGAGLFLGLLLFKPQFALPLIGLFVFSGRWLIGIGSIVTAVAMYAIGVWMQGWDWVGNWFQFASWVSKGAAVIDPQNAVSWLGLSEALLGAGTMTAKIIGWTLALATIFWISWVWLAGERKGDLTARMGLATLCLVLIPPHVMYYDVGLLFFTYTSLTAKGFNRQIEIVTVVWVLAFSQILANSINFSPLFLISIFTGILVIRNLGQSGVKQKGFS